MLVRAILRPLATVLILAIPTLAAAMERPSVVTSGEPRVELIGHEHIVVLPKPMKKALDRFNPKFTVWRERDYWVLPASVWVKVEAAAVEVDRGLEVLPVAEAAGGVPDPLDLRIQALGGRVGDPVAEVGEDVREVRLEHPRLLDHGRQARVRRPEVPVAEELAGGPDVAVLPEVRGRLLERPGPGHLERAVA